jgi:predicted transcriptional regulator
MMTEITVQLPDEILQRLTEEAQRRNLPLDAVIHTAIAHFLDDEEPTEAEVLSGLRRSMQQVLAGQYRPAHDVLDEIERETVDDADDR